MTERGLARACGLSQPHMHNVLKSVRVLSLEAADRLLLALDLNVTDLIVRFPFDRELEARAIPVLRSRIGPGITPSLSVYAGFLAVPVGQVKDLINPVCARVAPDLSLPEAVEPGDIILLDQNPAVRALPAPDSMYVVRDGDRVQVRYVWLSGDKLHLASSQKDQDPATWPSISIQRRDILEVVRARIVWISREVGQKPF